MHGSNARISRITNRGRRRFAWQPWLNVTSPVDKTTNYFFEDVTKRNRIHQNRIATLKTLQTEYTVKKKEHAGHEYAFIYPLILRRVDEQPRQRREVFRFKTPDRRRKFEILSKYAISPWFSLGCGLTVAGSLLSALMVLSGGSAVLLPFLITTSFLFIMAMLNWKTIQKRVPEMLHAMFAHKFFKRLFEYSSEEYKDYLNEYWIDMDDRVRQARRHIRFYQAKISSGNKLTLNEQRKYALAQKDLKRLVDERNHHHLPSRELSKVKKAAIVASLPLNLAGGFMIGVLTYNLSITTILQAFAFITGTAALFSTPPGWAISIAMFLSIITAPTMTGIFIYGTSCLAKLYRPFRKVKHFFQNLFKEEIPNPDGAGIKRTYTRKGFFKGIFKVLAIMGAVGIIMVGNVSQMLGGVYLLNEFMKGPLWLNVAYAISIMGVLIHSPFYIMQTAKTARQWFKDKRDYFRDPFKVLDKRIERINELVRGNAMGKSKGKYMIDKLMQERHKLVAQEKQDATKTHFVFGLIPVPGQHWVKLPFWLRDFLKFQITKTIGMVGKTFLSGWGAVTAGSVSLPDDGGYVPDSFYREVSDKYDILRVEVEDDDVKSPATRYLCTNVDKKIFKSSMASVLRKYGIFNIAFEKADTEMVSIQKNTPRVV